MTQRKALLCAFAGFLAWVWVDAAIKLGSQQALSPFMIMAVLGLVGTVGLVGSALARGNLAVLRPLHWRQQLMFSGCSLAVNYANVVALKHLSLTLFYIFVFTAPLMVAGLSAAMKLEKLTVVKMLCLVAGFLGVVLAVGVQGTNGGEWSGYVAVIVCAFSFALSTVVTRKISQTDSIESLQLMNVLPVGVFGLLGALSDPFPGAHALTMMLVAGVFSLLGNVLYNKALKHTSSTNVAQLHYTQIVSGALVGYVLWHEVPTWNLIAGSLIIIASGMVVAARANKTEVLGHESVEADV